jgi:hypothetical protein
VTPDPAPVPALPTTVQRAIRTGIAAAVGFLVGYVATHFAIHLSSGDEGTVIGIVDSLVMFGYASLALWAEKRWSWARWLLLRIGN